jgi:uncharacterized protein YqjF (DUF2071 family)
VSSFSLLGAVARQTRALAEVGHRDWPPPETPWVQAHTREDVVFAHWRVGLDEIARLLPPDLPLDTYDGSAWLGLVACRLTGVRLRGLPPVPRLAFRQLEIRAYVDLDDRPGMWLCSIDASNPLLVEAAKRAHRLPAYRARIVERVDSAGGLYDVRRDGLEFAIRYRAEGAESSPEPGTLEHFLTERYCVYTADGGRLYRAELHHPRWRVQPATATISASTLSPAVLDGAPHVLYSTSQDVLVWPLEEL